LFNRGNRAHARAEDRLYKELIIWLTTVTGDGQPQSSPVWFVWDGSTFLVFSRSRAKKLSNLATNPRVSLHLEGNGLGGDNVIFEGTSEVTSNGARITDVPDYVSKYREQIEALGWTPESMSVDYSVPIRITPSRVRIW
jgi:PPOX class probable F420-dependent enzyme